MEKVKYIDEKDLQTKLEALSQEVDFKSAKNNPETNEIIIERKTPEEVAEEQDNIKAIEIINGLEAKDKVDALVKQANLSRKFLMVLFKALPADVQSTISKDPIFLEVKQANDLVEQILNK